MKMKSNQSANKVIIIVGAAVSGKSTLSFEIAKSLEIKQVIDTDIIRAVKITQNPHNKYLNIYSYTAWKNFGKKQTKKSVLRGYKKYAMQLAKEIKGVIKINSSLGRNIILEGVHLHPELLKDIYKLKNVYAFLIHVDKNTHQRYIKNRVHTDPDFQKYYNNFKALRIINDYIYTMSKKYGIQVVHNNRDIRAIVKKIKAKVGG